jgi:DMSO reductase anchor subunit
MDPSWQDVFTTIILLIVAALGGAPLIQVLKNILVKKYGPIGERAAVILAAIVSFMLAFVELLLEGLLTAASFTVDALPGTFFVIFGVATIYYTMFKGADSILGRKLMLPKSKKPDPLL